ncbi:MAG: DUF4270 family protein [Saprospiraceae bacterium]|nr:DUF4270 family protein [Saprospiraceae bacterium]
MKNIRIAFLGLAVCLVLAASCNKTSLLGSELFENDKLNLQFTDTLSLNALTDAPIPVLMHVKDITGYDNLPIGNMPDAYFGKLESSIYAQFGLQNVVAPTFPSLDSAKIDSIRFIMPYNASGTYGDTTATQKLVVYRLTEEIKGDSIYSNKTFANEATPLGSLTFKPTPNTTSNRRLEALPGATKVDTFVDIPHVSIPLDINFGKDIMRLSSTTLSDTAFQTWLKGIVIKSETPANCMLSFNMSPSAGTTPTGQSSRVAGIYVYYRNNATDTTRQVYTFYTSGQPRYANYKNDYLNGKVKDFINSPKKADSLVFLQSLGGSVARLEFPYLKNMGNIAINKAELEFTINEDADTKTIPPAEQLILLTSAAKIADGNIVNLSGSLSLIATNSRAIADVGQSGYSVLTFNTIPDFGGYPFTENGVQKYKMNITQQLQKMLNGSEGTQLYLAPHFQYTRAGRVVLYGAKHPKYKMKVNLIFTKI